MKLDNDKQVIQLLKETKLLSESMEQEKIYLSIINIKDDGRKNTLYLNNYQK